MNDETKQGEITVELENNEKSDYLTVDIKS